MTVITLEFIDFLLLPGKAWKVEKLLKRWTLQQSHESIG